MVDSPSRREFLATTATASLMASVAPVHAAGSEIIKVGLIGCGGRGTGAASQALNADPNVKLVAMGDAFEDRLRQSLSELKRDEKIASKVDVQPDHCFVGFDAYKHVIASGVDVVLLATPPHFRPMHFQAAIDAGKHVFAEKPVAVDAKGVRAVLATCEEAKKKNLSVVSGLSIRYDNGFRETISRIHAGAMGEVHCLKANDYRGGIWVKPRQPGWTDMHYQMRNWYYFTWLCGDFNVEQHIHLLDTCSWIMGQYPVKAVGTGGRQQRTGPEHGNIFDHFAITYDYANGANLFATCRQQVGCANEIKIQGHGSRGHCVLDPLTSRFAIQAEKEWKFTGPKNNMFQTEHDALFASIRSSKPINNGDYMAKSTLLAIMGRMAAYTGQVITWEMALNSKEDLSPPKYDWDVSLTIPPVAVPGKTKFV
jgi:predicted dehydrogenase